MSKQRKFVNVSAGVPGKKAKAITERRQQNVAKGISNLTPVVAESGKGALLTDVDGNTFIDFAAAIGTVNAGHCPDEVVAAVKAQLDKLIHPGFNVAMYESYIQLAEKLNAITPGTHEKKTMFANSGAEAVENAVKIARKFTGRPGIVSFTRAFHGRTLLGMSLTSKVRPYKFQMGPFAPATYKAPFPYMFHKPASMTDDEYVDYSLKQFEEFFLTEVAAEEVAAVIMEPVQGEGGFVVPPKAFVQGVYNFCQKHGILFIADEIQTGFCRTGSMFAISQFDVVPDIMTMSKSIAAGLPISAVTGRAEVMDAPNPGEIGGTYNGSPLACVAALAVIEKMESEDLAGRSRQIGETIRNHFTALQAEYPVIGDVRGLGAMCAVEFVDPATGAPEKELVGKLIKGCYESGVICLSAGVNGNIIRFLSPLVITDEQLQEGLDIMTDVLKSVYVTN